MNYDAAKTQEDTEKTQDGREDEAERIVKANKYIRVAAEESFKKLEKFLEDAMKELDDTFRTEGDMEVNVENIISKMQECERKRESIAILSCDPIQLEDYSNQPTSLLGQFMDGIEVKDMNIFASPWKSPSLDKRQYEENERRKRKRLGFIRRLFQPKKSGSVTKTPQSSVMDDTVTQASEPMSIHSRPVSAESSESDVKTKPKKKIRSKEVLEEQKNTKKREKKKKRRHRKPRSAAKSPTDNRKKWWQFW